VLITGINDFNFSVDNITTTFSDGSSGTSVPGNASANLKGANTQLLTGIAQDCYGLAIGFNNGSTSAAIRRQMVDLLVDPGAGVGGNGASWSVAISNLYANSPCLGAAGNFGYWYYFPLFLKAGTAIGAAHADTNASSAALRVMVKVFGKPSRPELIRVGTKVQTIGATLASVTGVAVAPTNLAYGAYSASLGTTSFDSWWWQLGIGSADTTMSATGYLFDVAANATNKVTLMEKMIYAVCGTANQASKSAFGLVEPARLLAAGQDIYVRGATTGGAADSSMTAVVYALGG
jgi:hypothetical protein